MLKKERKWNLLSGLPRPSKVPRKTSVKQQAASSPDTEPQVLDRLADSDDPNLLERVAENTQADPCTLEKLSSHDAPEVRSAVAENGQTPPDVLKTLASDDHPDVRYRLAENAGTPVEILETLSSDENPYVSERAKHTLDSVAGLAERADNALLNEHFAEAEALYVQLVGELEKLLGRNHAEVSNALHKLAAALAAQDKHDEATYAAQRAEDLKVQGLDGSH